MTAKANILSGGTYSIQDQIGIDITNGSVQPTKVTLSKNAAELNFSLTSGSTQVALPHSITVVETVTGTITVNIVWLGNLIQKVLHLTYTTGGTFNYNDYKTLNFPALSSNRIVNGVEYNPDSPNQAGTWYYYWYFIQQTSLTKVTITKSGSFTYIFRNSDTFYVPEIGTNKTGWYWVAHNQGGITYYGL